MFKAKYHEVNTNQVSSSSGSTQQQDVGNIDNLLKKLTNTQNQLMSMLAIHLVAFTSTCFNLTIEDKKENHHDMCCSSLVFLYEKEN